LSARETDPNTTQRAPLHSAECDPARNVYVALTSAAVAIITRGRCQLAYRALVLSRHSQSLAARQRLSERHDSELFDAQCTRRCGRQLCGVDLT